MFDRKRVPHTDLYDPQKIHTFCLHLMSRSPGEDSSTSGPPRAVQAASFTFTLI